MKISLANLRETISSSYWFVPGIMTAAAVALSLISVELDRRVQDAVLEEIGLIWSGGAEGARELLATVAGSTITVAGVIFSMTLVVLSLTSQQFGPRLLRQFMGDRGTQVVLGTFVATFVFCLLVLRTVRSMDEAQFVPYLSVTLAVLFMLASLGVLIYFIHHVARLIQAPRVVARAGEDLLAAVNRVFPEQLGEAAAADEQKEPADWLPEDFEARACPIAARENGYLQAINVERLFEKAKEKDILLRIPIRPGHFVVEGESFASGWPCDRIDDELADDIRNVFVVGPERTVTQDVELVMEQLVEVAVRSLSPSINDPFTAMTCIDWLGAALSRAVGREFPRAARADEEGVVRLLAEQPITFEGLIIKGTDLIRHHAAGSPVVTRRLVEMLYGVAQMTDHPARREVLQRQIALIRATAK